MVNKTILTFTKSNSTHSKIQTKSGSFYSQQKDDVEVLVILYIDGVAMIQMRGVACDF